MSASLFLKIRLALYFMWIIFILFEGVSKIKNILIIFGFIGALIAVWRLSGTIGVICMMISNTVGIDPLIIEVQYYLNS